MSSRAPPIFWMNSPDTPIILSVTRPLEISMFWASAMPESCIWRETMSEVSLRWDEMVPLVVTSRSLMLEPVDCNWPTTPEPACSMRE